MFVKIPPTQLSKPVKVIRGVPRPINFAINSAQELLVAKEGGDVIVIDKRGKKVPSIWKVQYGFKQLHSIIVDKDNNIDLFN